MPERHTHTWAPYRFESDRIVRTDDQPESWPDGSIVKMGMDLFRDEEWPVVGKYGRELWRCDMCNRSYTMTESLGVACCPHGCDTGKWVKSSTITDLRRDVFRVIDANPDVRFVVETEFVGSVVSRWEIGDDAAKGLANVYRTTPDRAAGLYDLDHDIRRQKRPNVTLATSVTNQQQADERLPQLIQCHDLCGALWIYYGGAEPVDWKFWNPGNPKSEGEWMASVEGVGVTGKNRPIPVIIRTEGQPTNIEYVRNTVRQCEEAGVGCWIESMNLEWVCKDGSRFPVCDERNWPDDLRAVNERWTEAQ